MGALALNQDLHLAINPKPSYNNQSLTMEHIPGVIKVLKNGSVERAPVTQSVTPLLPADLGVTARDVYIDTSTNVWARVYVPKRDNNAIKLPLLVYYHGGGFCVGSTAWKCYHDFLGNLSSKINCIIVSVNYRLAPENPLPAAYEDGIKAVMWVKRQAGDGPGREYWAKFCDFRRIFLSGDSAGANIAYNVVLKISASEVKPLEIKGIVMIQPFFGGEQRTGSQKIKMPLSAKSTLNLAFSDAFWRMALPQGANRDHPWCNPLGRDVKLLPECMRVMVCVAEDDILRDRIMEMCDELANAGNVVECKISEGVGHGFQVISDDSQVTYSSTLDMISGIVAFVNCA